MSQHQAWEKEKPLQLHVTRWQSPPLPPQHTPLLSLPQCPGLSDAGPIYLLMLWKKALSEDSRV